jgi:hypothetical protein
MPSVSKIPEDSWGLAALQIGRRGCGCPARARSSWALSPSRTPSTRSDPGIEVNGGAAAYVTIARDIKLCCLHSAGRTPSVSSGVSRAWSPRRQLGRNGRGGSRAQSANKRRQIPGGALVWPVSDLHHSSGGGGLVRHRGCFNDLRVEHRVCPSKFVARVGRASIVAASAMGVVEHGPAGHRRPC